LMHWVCGSNKIGKGNLHQRGEAPLRFKLYEDAFSCDRNSVRDRGKARIVFLKEKKILTTWVVD